MNTHTPGPWKIREGGSDTIVETRAGLLVTVAKAAPNRSTTSARANARLIAAAPELLAALEAIVNDTPGPGEDAQLTAKGYNLACAAIMKAKGE